MTTMSAIALPVITSAIKMPLNRPLLSELRLSDYSFI